MTVNRKADSKDYTAHKMRRMLGRGCGGESQRLGGEVDRGTWGRQKLGGPTLGKCRTELGAKLDVISVLEPKESSTDYLVCIAIFRFILDFYRLS